MTIILAIYGMTWAGIVLYMIERETKAIRQAEELRTEMLIKSWNLHVEELRQGDESDD